MAQIEFPIGLPVALTQLMHELHALHGRAGWPSMRDIAKKTSPSHTTINKVFHGHELPSLPVLKDIVEALVEIESRGQDAETTVQQALGRIERLWTAAAEEAGMPTRGATLKIPALTEEVLAAVSPGKYAAQERSWDTLGSGTLELIRTPAQLVVRADRQSDGQIVRCAAYADGVRSDLLLFPLYSKDGFIVGEFHTDAEPMSMRHDLEISLIQVGELGPAERTAIPRSVRGTTAAGRNQWRQIASRFRAGHPLRTAVVEGLREHSGNELF